MLGNPRLRAGTPDQARAAAATKSAQARARAANVAPYPYAPRRAGARTLAELAEALTNRGVPMVARAGPKGAGLAGGWVSAAAGMDREALVPCDL